MRDLESSFTTKENMKKYILFAFLPFLASCSISFVGPNEKNNIPTFSVSPSSEISEIVIQGTIEKISAESIFTSDSYILKTPEGMKYILKSPLSEDFSQYLTSIVQVKGQIVLKTYENGEIPSITVIRIEKISEENDAPSFIEVSKGVFVKLLPNWTLTKGKTDSLWKIQDKTNKKEIIELTFHTSGKADQLIEEDFSNAQAIIVGNISSLRIAEGSTHRILFKEEPFLEISFVGSDSNLSSFYDFLLSIEVKAIDEEVKKRNSSPSPSISITPKPSSFDQKISPSPYPTEIKEEKTQSNEHTKVIFSLSEEISSLSPEEATNGGKWDITRTAFMGDNIVSVEYSDGTEKRKAIFKYTIEDTPSFDLLSYYKPGETTSWTLVEGSSLPFTTKEGEDQIIYLPDGEEITIPLGYELYISKNFNFQIAYPKKLYYSAIGKREGSDALATIFFAEEPADNENAIMFLEIYSTKEESDLEDGIIVSRDEETYFLLTAIDPNYEETIAVMAKTIQNL